MRKKIFHMAIFLIAVTSTSFAQQWSGSTGTTGTITREGLVTIQNEGSGLIVDDPNYQRVGFMKYFGKYAGIWRNPGAWFEIGRVSGTILSPTAYTTDLYISGDGNIGVGTTAPGTFKLAVEGKVGAREFRVTSVNPWPDYVFHNNYQLKNLYALESYIRQNNHLPNIPTAQEVKQNGIELGQMNAKLLEKIEELTLYIIELNKKIDTLEKRNPL
jgi:hypothetical protein